MPKRPKAKERSKKGPGRRPLPDEARRDPKIDVRFRPDERELIAQAAAHVGERDSHFVREAALTRARRTLGPEE